MLASVRELPRVERTYATSAVVVKDYADECACGQKRHWDDGMLRATETFGSSPMESYDEADEPDDLSDSSSDARSSSNASTRSPPPISRDGSYDDAHRQLAVREAALEMRERALAAREALLAPEASIAIQRLAPHQQHHQQQHQSQLQVEPTASQVYALLTGNQAAEASINAGSMPDELVAARSRAARFVPSLAADKRIPSFEAANAAVAGINASNLGEEAASALARAVMSSRQMLSDGPGGAHGSSPAHLGQVLPPTGQMAQSGSMMPTNHMLSRAPMLPSSQYQYAQSSFHGASLSQMQSVITGALAEKSAPSSAKARNHNGFSWVPVKPPVYKPTPPSKSAAASASSKIAVARAPPRQAVYAESPRPLAPNVQPRTSLSWATMRTL